MASMHCSLILVYPGFYIIVSGEMVLAQASAKQQGQRRLFRFIAKPEQFKKALWVKQEIGINNIVIGINDRKPGRTLAAIIFHKGWIPPAFWRGVVAERNSKLIALLIHSKFVKSIDVFAFENSLYSSKPETTSGQF